MEPSRKPPVALLVFLLLIPLLFSCASPLGSGKGALRIQVPGQAARSAFDDYTAALRYRIDCAGPGGGVARDAGPGSTVTIELEPGEWAISLAALHYGERVGESEALPVSIASGKTSFITLTVAVEFNEAVLESVTADGAAGTATTGLLILRFDRDIPGLTADDIVIEGNGIAKDGLTQVAAGQYELALRVLQEGTLSVAVNKPGCQVSLSGPSSNQASVHSALWPPDTTWEDYGLSGLEQPADTRVLSWEIDEGVIPGIFSTLSVVLNTANDGAYDAMLARLQPGGTLISSKDDDDRRSDAFMYGTRKAALEWDKKNDRINLTVDRV